MTKEKQEQRNEHEAEKKSEDNTTYVVYALIGVVIVFAAIFAIRFLWHPTVKIPSYMYNGFVFQNITGLWYTQVQRAGTADVYNVPLHFGPKEVENVPISYNSVAFKNITAIYITFDPLGTQLNYVALSAAELSNTLAEVLNVTPVAACTVNETDACKERPIIDCGSGFDTIYFSDGNETRVFQNNSCIVVEGEQRELTRATDRLILSMIGIMP